MFHWLKGKLGRDDADPQLRKAEALRAEGKAREARACCEEVLRSRPDDAQACCLIANLAADAKDTVEGLAWARRAAAADPRLADARYVEGRLLEAEGRLPEAETSYRAALALAPADARVHNNLGGVLHMQGRLDAALASYRRALELDPAQPQARQNYASIVRDSGALEQAIEGYQRQITSNPRDAAAHTNLANTYRELGRYPEAMAAYQRAIEADPNDAEAHFSRSFVLLITGDYREGWREYEWRLRVATYNAPLRRFPQPAWNGSPVTGGSLLLHAEQGFGDTLQFARYVALAAERCPSVVLLCQPELRALLRPLKGAARILGEGELVPDYAAHAPLMSLPSIFGTTLDTVPWDGPYVRPDPEQVAAWRPVVGPDGASPRIGIAWAGRAEQWDDRKRSMTLPMLGPLAEAGGEFYSLQKGEASGQAVTPPAGMRLRDLTARLRDFSDTAALIANLDLVVTIDSAVAHLSAAMGVPTWVLVAHAPDWRYHLERSDNPWYPTMRLFRQDRDGDWSGPVARAAQALRERSAQKQGG